MCLSIGMYSEELHGIKQGEEVGTIGRRKSASIFAPMNSEIRCSSC